MRSLRIKSLFIIMVIFFSCDEEKDVGRENGVDLTESFFVEINLKDRSNDTFKVTMMMDDLTSDNAVIQFAATVPGMYQITDIGRFVVNLKAFDEDHHELNVTHTSTNQWVLSDPENTGIIEYEVRETFDTQVTENMIGLMGGTSLEKTHALLNTFDIIGYPQGLKERDFYLSVVYPGSWNIATSLPAIEPGFYHASDYDNLVDNPLLLGNISLDSKTVTQTTVTVSAFSKSNLIAASDILNDIEVVLEDAEEFLNGLPVDRYNFIYVFDDFNSGALEHSYSSVYVLADQPHTEEYGQTLKNIAAHEFFHIVTPLNIHSEIIEDFNFAVPTPSEHLWLYEGVTEWASHLMQYRNNHVTIDDLLNELAYKKSVADYFDGLALMSLSEMSLNAYGAGGQLFGNVYHRGALVAALLDIRLLELSGGTKGLREVILELIDTYGAENAFSEETFFEDFATLTGYPDEVTDFMETYILGTEELPLEEYFEKIGIEYDREQNIFTVHEDATPEQISLREKWSVNL